MTYNVYQDDELIAEEIKEKEYEVEGLKPDTEYSFSVSEVIGDKESEKATVNVKTKPVKVTGITLSPKTSTGEAGTAGDRQLTATVSPSNATNKGVKYTISPSAEGLSVNSNGKIEWTEDVPVGEYTTTVTTNDGEYTDTHVLTLTEPEPDPEEGD